MRVHRRKEVTGLLIVGLAALNAGNGWRAFAQGRGAAAPPVQPIPTAKPAPVTSGDRGATYHALENDAIQVKTRFKDAVAVARRETDGRLVTTLNDLAGNEIATLKVRHVDAENDSIEIGMPDKPAKNVARRAGLRPTLDWTNEQSYSLWKDRAQLDTVRLEWQDHLMRPAGAKKHSADAEPLGAEVEWRGGLSSSVIKKTGTHNSYLTNQKVTGLVYLAVFEKDGVEIGSSQYWPDEQAFAWSFPGLTDGYLTADRLKLVGGWKLTPDMAWMNTQNLAFYRFHSAVNARSPFSKRSGGWLDRVASLFSVTVAANEAGCDGLHWLDNSIFRPCCDVHDQCYQAITPACSSWSWWFAGWNWFCDFCNQDVVVCFASGGMTHIYHRAP